MSSIYHQKARQIQSYLENLFAEEDPTLKQALRNMVNHGIPLIQITPLIGKTLYLLAKIHGAKKILEIGTLGGYSSIWLSRAAPVTTIEADSKHAKVARENLHGLPCRIIEGDVMQVLPTLTETYDFIFLDADKSLYPDLIEPMIELLQPGGLLLADNLVRRGKVLDPKPNDPQLTAIAKFNRMIAEDPRLESVILPTLVGHKGGDLDGLSVSLLKRPQSSR